jgi:chemotaxis protein methyltransferase CheR
MRDADCVGLLRWALPRLGLRWEGFRRMRRQVCRRVDRRRRELGLDDLEAYRAYLEANPDEWARLDSLCTVSVSRFYRDRAVFDALATTVLPRLASAREAAGGHTLPCWSAGCASGEEAYTVSILWKLALAPRHPDLQLRVVATDVDATLLRRAGEARYSPSSLRELPAAWREAAFERSGGELALLAGFREGVELRRADLRGPPPDEPFDLVLCRNLAFTYLAPSVQLEVLDRIVECLRPGGALVVGSHERLPPGSRGLVPWDELRSIYRRRAAVGPCSP